MVKMLLERGADIHAMTDEGETEDIERLQICFGIIVREDSEKGPTRSSCDLNALSDWRFDFSS